MFDAIAGVVSGSLLRMEKLKQYIREVVLVSVTLTQF